MLCRNPQNPTLQSLGPLIIRCCAPGGQAGPFPCAVLEPSTQGASPTKLLHEGIMERQEVPKDAVELGFRRQDGGSEVEGALLLAETRPRDSGDSRGLQQPQAVEHIRCLARRLSSSNSSRRQGDLWESVESALNLLAVDAWGTVECLTHTPGTIAQALQQLPLLLLIPGVGRVPRPGGVAHECQGGAAQDVGRQVDAEDLVHLPGHLGVDVGGVEVAAAHAALAVHALGHRVELDQLAVVPVGRAHAVQHLPAGDKGPARRVHVILIHLVRQQNDALLVAEPDEVLQLRLGEALAGGVARVDEHQRPHRDAPRPRLPQRPAHGVGVEPPGGLLAQLVAHQLPVQQPHQRRVQRVLRDGHHDAVVLVAQHGVQAAGHGLGGAVRDIHVLRARRDAVPAGDVLGALLAEDGLAARVPIRADAAGRVRQVEARAGDGVGLEGGGGGRVVQQRRVRHQGQHLAVEGDGALAERVRVAAVREDHLLPLL
mmetsp:Transcript_7824/g.12798  ORF Transcript_7824/g.12798 Transcript_7824/m.12798 type:complete len:485 (+) Transcript_7824:414-1868(+)